MVRLIFFKVHSSYCVTSTGQKKERRAEEGPDSGAARAAAGHHAAGGSRDGEKRLETHKGHLVPPQGQRLGGWWGVTWRLGPGLPGCANQPLHISSLKPGLAPGTCGKGAIFRELGVYLKDLKAGLYF